MKTVLLLCLALVPLPLKGEIITEFNEEDSQGYWATAPYQIVAVKYVFQEKREMHQIQLEFWKAENLRVWISQQDSPDSLFYQDLEDTTKILSVIGDISVGEADTCRWLTFDLPEMIEVQGIVWVVGRLTNYGPGEANHPGLVIRGNDAPPRTSCVKVTEIAEPGVWGPLGSNIACTVVVDEYLGIDDGGERKIPRSYSLGQNFPNPFNPQTVIRFSLGEQTHASLKVYNLRGQEVETLLERDFLPGEYQVSWDGTDRQGRKVPSGIYLYRLITEEGILTRKMVLVQ